MEYEKPGFLDLNDLNGKDGLPIAQPMAVIVLFLVAAVIYTVAGVFTVVGAAAIELVGFAATHVAMKNTTPVN